MPISQKCLDALTENTKESLEAWVQVTRLREFVKASGGKTTGIDMLFGEFLSDPTEWEKNWETNQTRFGNAEADALGEYLDLFHETFSPWMGERMYQTSIPGWDEDSCSLDIRQTACFFSEAARVLLARGPESLKEHLDRPRSELVELSTGCKAVKDDEFYNLYEADDGDYWSGPWPWVVGAALAAVGGWLVMRKG